MQQEDDSEDYSDDRITEALLDGSTYRKISVQTYRWFSAPVPDRLKWQALLLFALAAVYPIIRLLPTGVKEAYFGTTQVATTSPTVALLAGACIVFTTLGATGHLGAIYLRLKWDSEMTRNKAHEIISLEETASLIGFGTAGIGAVVTHFFVSIGFNGADAVSRYGITPYELSGSFLTVKLVAIFAVSLGIVLYVAGYAADIRLDDEDIEY